jgi:hypothetical protein
MQGVDGALLVVEGPQELVATPVTSAEENGFSDRERAGSDEEGIPFEAGAYKLAERTEGAANLQRDSEERTTRPGAGCGGVGGLAVC